MLLLAADGTRRIRNRAKRNIFAFRLDVYAYLCICVILCVLYIYIYSIVRTYTYIYVIYIHYSVVKLLALNVWCRLTACPPVHSMPIRIYNIWRFESFVTVSLWYIYKKISGIIYYIWTNLTSPPYRFRRTILLLFFSPHKLTIRFL
jgi:hypothetical protein